jgi:ABC-type multidrug transport system fused ATPase/permease subunit
LELAAQRNVLLAIRRRGITCLLISQSMAWLADCEQIALLDGGRILEQGTHQELLAKKGHYYALCAADQMYDAQSAGGYANN